MSVPPLVVHIIYSLSTGGLENGLVNIINRCPENRYRHTIVCLTTADDFATRISAPNVEVIVLNKREGHDLSLYLRLWRLLRKLRPAIVHSRNLAPLEMQICTLGLPGVKRVHGEHGREINDLDGTNVKYLLLRKAMRALIHRYITVSQDLERWMIETVGARPDRVIQIYNGVDTGRFSPVTVKPVALLPAQWTQQNAMLVIGTVGRLTPVKDQQRLLQAVSILRSEHPALGERIRLLIVGDGPLRQSLEGQVAELGLDDCAWLAGDRDDVADLLQVMDVFVLPSLAEGISNTVLEAMASGLPVIATRTGGNVELVEPEFNGALVPVGDAQALADTLQAMLSDPGLLKTLGNNARERIAQRFDWDRTVNEYLSVYDNLLNA